MPVIRPLTELQIETLEAAINKTLTSSIKSLGHARYLQFSLPNGREVTRRVIALRKRGFLAWAGKGVVVVTEKGINEWRRLEKEKVR